MVRAVRPKQWVKNVLVVVVPLLDGGVNGSGELISLAAAFVSFTLIASGAYLLNDVLDVERDRRHPTKRHRPIAAGVVPVPVALTSSAVFAGGGIAVSGVVGWQFLVLAALYLAYTISYSVYLKHVETVELVFLAGGFVLRTVAGAVAVSAGISAWFFVCIAGAALLVASGKRTAELAHAPDTRPVLAGYNEAFLTSVRSAACAIAVTSYAMWTFDTDVADLTLAQVSLLPFTIAVLRYTQIASNGDGGEPEEVLTSDRVVGVAGLCCAVLVAAAMVLR